MAWMRSGVRSPSAPLLGVSRVPGGFPGPSRRPLPTRAQTGGRSTACGGHRRIWPLPAEDSSARARFGQHGHPNAVRLEHADARPLGSEAAPRASSCASLHWRPPSLWRLRRLRSRSRVRCRTFPRTKPPRTKGLAPTRPPRRRRRSTAPRPHRRPARTRAPARGARLLPRVPRRRRPMRALLPLRTPAGQRRPQTRASVAATSRIPTRFRCFAANGAPASASPASARARARRRTARGRGSCRAARAITVSRRMTRHAARTRRRSAPPTRHASPT